TAEEKSKMLEHLCRMIIARDEKFFRLAKENLSLEDFLAIKTRMVGTGFIGGKSVGMLIARSILLKEKDLKAEEFFEPHDSFYIGSDVFYTYIVENGWWKARMDQRTKDGYFKVANILKEQMLSGVFPEEIKEQFKQMIDYFGQSPIIVRSSSLLEDSFGNAFAGKYESIFLVNQGTPDERYARFSEAVRRIYASTMNEDALAYRLQRGLDQQDEQMALLVQRVSGAYHKDYFFPDAAGVGISYNTFVWKKDLDPEAGMLRIVLGLGTRAVNRVEGDYPRIVALDQPLLKAHSGLEDAQKFSQHDIDLLNIRENKLQTRTLRELLNEKVEIKLDLLAVRDYEASERMRQMGKDEESWIINFDTLFTKTDFRETLQKILKILQAHYGYPVDIEFTVNFDKHDKFKINLLQCRTIQGRGLGKRVEIPEKIEKERILFESQGNFLGGNFSHLIRRVIYVDPQGYSQLPVTGKYDIARAVGELNRQIKDKEEFPVILLGPGRWGTTTPSLGVPVSFAEINNISVLAEVSFASANCIPELSFGTHFFQDLIETGIFYVALFVDNKEAFLNTEMIGSWPNSLTKFAQSYAKYSPVIKVYDLDKKELRIVSDIISQKVVCFH
ncbi:MAG: PEP/pyruvate-binding domain-containing protein, partial [Candidatus Omnitrophica bacterium]|nr:PEP/pyruvate-binding domain-containing protein [Candidatus Omnitrophota bacterium]